MQDSEIFYLRAEAHNPWHLYVGVVLSDKEGRIAIVEDPDGTFTLPRETVASDDSIVRLVHRLVLEQVGVVPEVRRYVGSHCIPFDRYDGTKTEKTILYFDAVSTSRYPTTSERAGLRWLAPEEAERFLREQPWGEERLFSRLQVESKA